jgi:hypothetical protein
LPFPHTVMLAVRKAAPSLSAFGARMNCNPHRAAGEAGEVLHYLPEGPPLRVLRQPLELLLVLSSGFSPFVFVRAFGGCPLRRGSVWLIRHTFFHRRSIFCSGFRLCCADGGLRLWQVDLDEQESKRPAARFCTDSSPSSAGFFSPPIFSREEQNASK